jgi:hypothetical protein
MVIRWIYQPFYLCADGNFFRQFLFQVIRMRKAIVRRTNQLMIEAGVQLPMEQWPQYQPKVALIIGFIILFRGKHDVHSQLPDFKTDIVYIKRAFKIGFPSSIEQSMRSIGMTVMTSELSVIFSLRRLSPSLCPAMSRLSIVALPSCAQHL